MTDCVCPAIMKFMGDFPLKGQTEQDLVTTILKVHTLYLILFDRHIEYKGDKNTGFHMVI